MVAMKRRMRRKYEGDRGIHWVLNKVPKSFVERASWISLVSWTTERSQAVKLPLCYPYSVVYICEELKKSVQKNQWACVLLVPHPRELERSLSRPRRNRVLHRKTILQDFVDLGSLRFIVNSKRWQAWCEENHVFLDYLSLCLILVEWCTI